jgi:Fe2+ or Zn2+ uptake regulation protein
VAKERAGAPVFDDLKSAIRAGGLRVTASRVAVLALLRSTPAPLSHGEIVERLGPDSFGDSRTIYKNLHDLTRAGLVSRVDGKTLRFRAADPQNA